MPNEQLAVSKLALFLSNLKLRNATCGVSRDAARLTTVPTRLVERESETERERRETSLVREEEFAGRSSAAAARRRRSLRAVPLVGVHPRGQRDRSERGASVCFAFETVDGFLCVRRLDPLPRPIGGSAPSQQNVCSSVVCRDQWDPAESHAGSSRRYDSPAAPARRLTDLHADLTALLLPTIPATALLSSPRRV